MVFSSLTFLFLFLPVIIVAYYLVRSLSAKNLILFIGSIIFYAWGEPVYVVLMILSIFNDYFHARGIAWFQSHDKQNVAKGLLISSIVVNLGLLSVFKYGDFFLVNLNRLTGMSYDLLNLALPVGISFYTFQTMSYTIDVYRQKVQVQRNFLTLATYVAMFPQLIAGPIVRYATIEQELSQRQISWPDMYEGVKRFIIGLGKKVIIANQMAIIADAVFGMGYETRGVSLAWAGLIAYAFQIYFDFSGYSDMAIGLGRIFGFHFLENFDYPYISRSITEFWRRWHISLSTWFRDYVYIPLGGNRVRQQRWFFNIFLVWALTGLWHGAAWNFVIWGLYYATLLVIEKLWSIGKGRKVPVAISYPLTMLLVLFGWVLFRSETLFGIITYSLSLVGYFGNNPLVQWTQMNLIYLLPFYGIAIIGSTPLPNLIIEEQSRLKYSRIFVDLFLAAVFIISMMFLINSSFNPFIYYRF